MYAVDFFTVINNADYHNIPIKYVAKLLNVPEQKVKLASKLIQETDDKDKIYSILRNDKVYTISELEAIIQSFIKETNITKLLLVGSYARGTATEDSDIDIIFDSNNIVDDYCKLCDELSSLLGKRVDVMEFDSIQNSVYKESLLDGSVLIYG